VADHTRHVAHALWYVITVPEMANSAWSVRRRPSGSAGIKV